jgi:DNA (cytosine-5)-methyltransferase 1
MLNFDERISTGELRDVSHTSSLQEGFRTGRARLIKRDSLFSPSVLKSQNRQAKDSLFIYDDVSDRYYFTSNKLLSELMGIEMNFDAVGGTLESEIIGQSIETPLHEALLDSINEHLIQSKQILSNRLF